MADEPENLVLQLLREMRAEHGRDLAEIRRGLVDIKRDVAGLQEGQAMTLGYLTQAKWRDERLARDLTMLANRVTVLEVHTGLTT